MSWKKIVILVGLLAALGFVIFFVNRGEKLKQEKEGKLLSAATAGVTRLELQRGERLFRFIRSDSMWNLESPIKTTFFIVVLLSFSIFTIN